MTDTRYMATTNRHPAHCTTCDAKVPAGHGRLVKVGGRWAVTCSTFQPRGSDDGYDAMKDSYMEANGVGTPKGRRY